MIILPSEHTMILAQDYIKDFNRQPAVGSDGHVSDHKNIVDILLTIPNARIIYGQVTKQDGQWYKLLPGALTNWSDYSPSPEAAVAIDFDEVRRIGETPGMIYISADPLDLADGVTDYKEDIFPDTAFMVYSAGLFGLDQVVPELILEIHSLRAGFSTLESDNSSLSTTVSTLESDSATLNTTVSQLGEDVTTLSNANSTLEEQVSTLESDNASLSATVSGLETDLGSLSSANDTLSSTVSTLEGNIATLTSDKEALEGQVSTLESTIGDLTSRLEALENPTNPE